VLPRIRTVKPEFFRHWDLFKGERETGLPLRLAYAGLWTCCDREGRFEWRPEELKVVVLPHDDVDFSRVLDALTTRGFVVKYTSGEDVFGCVPTFKTHQAINNKEKVSKIPPPSATPCGTGSSTCVARVQDATATRGERAPDVCHTGTGTGTGTDEEGPPSPPNEEADRLDVPGLRALWNEHAARNGWPTWNLGAKVRDRHARALLGNHSTRARWSAALERATRSSFLMGRTPRTGTHANWRPTPDWLLRTDTLIKIEEGFYDDTGATTTSDAPPAFDEHGLEIA
jgi:hypothetical protein